MNELIAAMMMVGTLIIDPPPRPAVVGTSFMDAQLVTFSSKDMKMRFHAAISGSLSGHYAGAVLNRRGNRVCDFSGSTDAQGCTSLVSCVGTFSYGCE